MNESQTSAGAAIRSSGRSPAGRLGSGRSVELLIGGAFAVASIALAVVGLSGARSLAEFERVVDARYRASQTATDIDRLTVRLVDAETGQRGFLITGDTAYLAPYVTALAGLGDDTIRVRAAAAGDTLLAGTLDRIGPMLAGKFTELAGTIALRSAGSLDSVRRIVAGDQGRLLMNRIRAELTRAREHEDHALDLRTARVKVVGARTRAVAGGTIAVTVAALVFAGLAIVSQLRARSAAEGTVREREKQLFQVLEAMPVAVTAVDRNGQPLFGNRRALEILGRPVDPGLDPSVASQVYQVYVAGTDRFYPPELHPGRRALLGMPVHAEDIEIHRGGVVIPLESWAAPVFGDDGAVAFAISAFTDVSERRRAQREIQALNAELARRVVDLESVNRELETFSYSVSHDLRAPLRAIDGYSRILLEDHGASLPPDAQQRLAVIRQRTQRMGNLIDDLLRLSKVNRKEIVVEAIDMAGLVKTSVADLGGDQSKRGRITVGQLPPAVGDAGLIRQVWANLLSNAVKYSAPNGEPEIEVGGRVSDGECIYFVRDNGVGFDMAYVDKLFGVFQRLHPADQFEGTGVGLALVQRIVHRHGGRAWAESSPGAGATFSFALPREPGIV